MDIINVTQAEIEMFGRLSRPEILLLPDMIKKKYLFAFQAKHIKLEIVARDLMSLLEPFSGINILFLIGATHVGKTTLAKRILKIHVEKTYAENYNDRAAVPFIFIPAPANGAKSLSWTSIYEHIMRAGYEILIEKKHAKVIDDDIMTIQPKRFKTLPALRDAMESMLEHRKVLVLAIDEAYHLLRFGQTSAVIMDTLKSIVDNTPTKLLLIGSYNLFDLASNYGQVASRSEILHFERYHKDNKEDAAEFFNVVNKIQLKWPCEDVPAFSAISDDLLEATVGCVGLLKKFLLLALDMQLKNKGKWKPEFLSKAAKSEKLLKTIRDEIIEGEEKIKEATYGESIFTGKILKDAIAKMDGAIAHG